MKLAEAAVDTKIGEEFGPYIIKTVDSMLDGSGKGPEYNLRLVKMLLVCNHLYERLKEG